MTEGEFGLYGYIIVKGQVNIYKDGEPIPIAEIGP